MWPKWQLLQRFGARVHLSQGKLSPQTQGTCLCDPTLGLLGDAKGRTWSSVQDASFREEPEGLCKRGWKRKAGEGDWGSHLDAAR